MSHDQAPWPVPPNPAPRRLRRGKGGPEPFTLEAGAVEGLVRVTFANCEQVVMRPDEAVAIMRMTAHQQAAWVLP